MLSRISLFWLFAISLNTSTYADSQRLLTDEGLFRRCYSHIAGGDVSNSHPLLAQVKAGSVEPIAACMSILDKATFGSGGMISSSQQSDPETLNVLKTFHALHRSFTGRVEFSEDVDQNYTKREFDASEPALFYTKALFDPATPFDFVVTSDKSLKALRNPTRRQQSETDAGVDMTHYEFPLEVGELIGVTEWSNQTSYINSKGQQVVAAADSPRTFGAGMLGAQSFLLMTLQKNFKADGATVAPRIWAEQVYKGALCRDVPLVRQSDVGDMVAAYVQKFPNDDENRVPFRVDSTCMSCHSGLDPLAAIARGFTGRRFESADWHGNGTSESLSLLESVTASLPRLETPLHLRHADADFYKRTPWGALFYRSFRGNLVNYPIEPKGPRVQDAFEALGQALAQQLDFYMCHASRYYQHFTGISVNLKDVMDPNNGGQISWGDNLYRQEVLKLAVQFRNHKDPRRLIQDIISLDQYRRSSLRLLNGN